MDVGDYQPRLKLQGPILILKGLFIIPDVQISCTSMVVYPGILRTETDGTVEIGDRLLLGALILIHHPPVDVGNRQLRGEIQGPIVIL